MVIFRPDRSCARNRTRASFDWAVVKAVELGVDIDNARAKHAYFATPVVLQKKIDSVTSLLAICADHFAMKSNRIGVQAAHDEPPVIVKARVVP